MEPETSAPSITPDLAQLAPPPEVQAENPHVFPSKGSMEWFVRQNYGQLAEHGALVKIGGRVYLHRVKFAACVLRIGQDEARRQHAD